MKKWLYWGAFLVLLVAGCQTAPKSAAVSPLRYDGLYQSTIADHAGDMAYWHYVRFYPNGDVIYGSTPGTPEQVSKWFARTLPHIPRGKVKLAGSRISFSVRAPEGTVDYAGEVQGERLRLSSYSHINGDRATEDYQFIPLSLPSP